MHLTSGSDRGDNPLIGGGGLPLERAQCADNYLFCTCYDHDILVRIHPAGALTPSTGIHKAYALSRQMSEPLNRRPQPHYRYLRGTCPLPLHTSAPPIAPALSCRLLLGPRLHLPAPAAYSRASESACEISAAPVRQLILQAKSPMRHRMAPFYLKSMLCARLFVSLRGKPHLDYKNGNRISVSVLGGLRTH